MNRSVIGLFFWKRTFRSYATYINFPDSTLHPDQRSSPTGALHTHTGALSSAHINTSLNELDANGATFALNMPPPSFFGFQHLKTARTQEN